MELINVKMYSSYEMLVTILIKYKVLKHYKPLRNYRTNNTTHIIQK